MVMLPGGVLPGACWARVVSMNTKLLGGFAHVSAVLAPCTLLTLVKFKLNKVPDPERGVEVFEKAEMRSVLIVLAPIIFALTFQLLAVNPAPEAGVPWKVTTEESKVKSPWKPTRLSAALMVDVVTGKVKFITFVPMFAIGKDTVATTDGVTRRADELTRLTEAVEFPGSGLARVGVKSPLMSPIMSAS